MSYLIIILIAMTIIAISNIIFNNTEPWYIYVIFTCAFTILSVLIDGFVAWVIRSLPEKWFDYHKKIFNPGNKANKFYKVIQVKRWKEKVPELGMFTSFRKNKISDPNNPEYLRRYVLEACYGVIIHYISVPFGFLIMLCDYKMYSGQSNLFLTVALPVAIVNAILILLPAFVLRYNLPKLIRLYEFKRKQKENGELKNETH